MKLKKLELYGFKSFGQRTTFEFEDSLSAVVGPNGAGKSNVADALKWVLGERSPGKLRSAEMSNVIFNGSETRKPLNYAEVTLTIDNSDGWLDLEYDEVAIRRRVDRTGRSEYHLNDSPCRLKDIRTLLMDTGVGTTSYSFIEQGQINRLLRSGPKERRDVFEEAAGINRFLTRKREAELKLQRVTQNLERVSDIVGEIAHQLRSVKYQAARARTFKEQSNQLQRLRLAYSLRKRRDLSAQEAHVKGELAAAETEESTLQRQSFSAQEELESARTRLEQIRTRLGERRYRLTRIESQLEGLARQADYNRQHGAELKSQLDELSQRRKSAAQRLRRLQEEIQQKSAALQETSAQLDLQTDRLQTQREQITTLRGEIRQVEEELKSKDRTVLELMARESGLHNQLEVLAARRQAAQTRAERLGNRRREFDSRIERAETERAQTTQKLDILQGRLAALNSQESDLSRRAAECQSRIASTEEDIQRTERKLSEKKGRRDTLRDLIERGEGLRSGVRRILDAAPTGLVGLLGRLLDVPLELGPAVEAVLGPMAQALVFNRREDALSALSILTENGSGQADVIALDAIPADLTPAYRPQAPEAEGPLIDLIKYDQAAAPAVRLLLGGALLVPNGPAARGLLSEGLPPGTCIVTTEGQCFRANGIWSVGSPQQPGIIGRRGELAHLQEQIAGFQQELSGLKRLAADEQLKMSELVEERQSLAQRTSALNRSAENMRRYLELAGREIATLRQDRDLTETETKTVLQDLEDFDGRRLELEERSAAAVREREAARSALKELQEDVCALQERENALSESIGALGPELARTRERHASLNHLLERLRAEQEQEQEELQRLQADEERNAEKRRQARQALEASQKEQGSLRDEKQELDADLARQTEAVQQAREGISALQGRSADLAERLQEAQRHAQELRLARQELQIKKQDLLERTAEAYGVRLDALERDPEQWKEASPFINRRIRESSARPQPGAGGNVAAWYAETDQEPDELEPISLDEAVQLRKAVLELADDAATDWGKINEQIQRLKTKVGRIGNVDVGAIRQQEELEIRLQFLTDQKEDLEKARRHEQEIIRKLNAKSRESLRETFAEVRSNFQALFRKLFGGGKADLMLDPEEDILEAGIEVMARPPGKETTPLSLLSGGEQTLTTIALLFAIFQAKPSPFCLLDEVDAPLDDHNLERFLMMLEQFRQNTQFIIITHNKLTMSVAEALYGITMTEGVTRKISVRFEDVQASLDSKPKPLARAG
ncbi:MAG: chromosome segregation protein SMC [Planctomycetes bacterium]|nr:chromosome segregation protein SMC [Planctomycetota bacterium]